MAPRLRTRSSRPRGPKRRLIWARTGNDAAELAAGPTLSTPTTANLLSDFETAYSSSLVGCTIMRIRGAITVSTAEEPATDVTDHVVAGWGIIVVSTTMGATSANFPDPLNTSTVEAHADWMGYDATHLIATGDATIQASGAYDGAGFRRFEVDVRARRRLDEMDDTVWLVFNSTPEATSWDYHLSMLIALP